MRRTTRAAPAARSMSRGAFLRGVGAAAVAGGAAMAGMPRRARAQVAGDQPANVEWDAANNRWLVYPSGNTASTYYNPIDEKYPVIFFGGYIPPITEDIYNIQWAVLQGSGDILLKSHMKGQTGFTAFEFGGLHPDFHSQVNITRDCVIEGEMATGTYPAGHALAGKQRMTEINGGGYHFGVNLHLRAYFTPQSPFFFNQEIYDAWTGADNVVVRNLVANNSRGFFLAAWHWDHNVEMDNIHLLDHRPSGFCFGCLLHHSGKATVKNCTFIKGPESVDFEGAIAWVPDENPAANWGWILPPQNQIINNPVEGYLLNNTIDWGTNSFGAIGIFANDSTFETPAITGLIQGNKVLGADVGMHVGGYGNYTALENDVTAYTLGVSLTSYDENNHTIIKSNKFHLTPSNSVDDLHVGCGVLGNYIGYWELDNYSESGFAFVGAVKNAVVSNNTFTGDSNVFVYMDDEELFNLYTPDGNPRAPLPGDCKNNVFQGNNWSGLTVHDGLSFVFGPSSSDNVVVGYTGGSKMVADTGTNNSYTGAGLQGLGKDAAQAKRDALLLSNELIQSIVSKVTPKDPSRNANLDLWVRPGKKKYKQ